MSAGGPLNRRVRTVARREYMERVRSRWFLFTTLVVPVLFLAVSALPVLLAEKLPADRHGVVVIDQTAGRAGRAIVDSLRAAGIPAELLAERPSTSAPVEVGQLRDRILSERAPAGTRTSGGDGATEDAAGPDTPGSAGAWLYLPPDLVERGKAVFVEDRTVDPMARRTVQGALNFAVRSARMEAAGLQRSSAERLLRPAELAVEPLNVEKGSTGFRAGLGLFFAFTLYMMFLIYGQMIARGVLEEKTSDIVEILISSLRPWEMMLGKILGIGAVGLTQVGIWALVITGVSVLGVASVTPMLAELGVDPASIAVPWGLIGWSLVYFVIGYLLYAALFAAAGAAVSGEQDIQQALWPVMIPIVIPIMFLPLVLQSPDVPLVVGLSLVPFVSPIWMPIRIAVSDVPFWQSIAAVALLVATTLFLAWVAGKIFRIGILMKGKRPNLPELMRWLRYD